MGLDRMYSTTPRKNSCVPINVDQYKILKYNVPKSIILLAM